MNLYWKYIRHHWTSLAFAGVLSIFFGLSCLLFTWLLVTICYYIDHNRAVKECREDQKHSEMLEALQYRTRNRVDQPLPEDLEEFRAAVKEIKELSQNPERWGIT